MRPRSKVWRFGGAMAGLALGASAGERRSGDYAIVLEAIDAGGGRSASPHYRNDGSVGGVGGVSAAAAMTAKHGLIGQLYEIAAVSLVATPPTLDENATRQLRFDLVLDDDSRLPDAPTDSLWSVLSGPLAVSPGGLATAAPVYADTVGQIQGRRQGIDYTIDLTVLDRDLDNFGGYGGDGIDDAWQVGFFGQPPNALAGPTRDPDGDRQDNLFEFLALVDPTDATSVFQLKVLPVPGSPLQRDLRFSPVSPLRTYTVVSSPDLNPAGFSPLVGAITTDLRSGRTVRDILTAPAPRRFYRVEISRD